MPIDAPVTRTTLPETFFTVCSCRYPSAAATRAASEYNNAVADWFLPLFPLKLVLFPHAELALHIFEERYKQMIGECLEHGWEFGIVLAEEDSLNSTGCTASILRVVKKYDDGRMDIIARGQRRFEILHLDHAMPYLRCEAQLFDDEEAEPPSEDARRQALELYNDLAKKLADENPDAAAQAPDAGDPQLSFAIAGRLPAELAFRQSLLPLRSESERLRRVILHLQQLTLRLTVVAKARARAGGNGRGRSLPTPPRRDPGGEPPLS
jgi:Lon protease-like protein